MKILALDLGKFKTMCCFFDTRTRKHEFLTAATERSYLTTVFKKNKVDLVVMEACGPSGWINDLAESLGLRTLVCSTNEDAWKLVECAWSSLRYNPWAKAIYERISGKQKTRKKKAAVALARKIAVIAWALLRDEKDWEPKRMIQVTESFGKMPRGLKETLGTMKPKENSDQRRSRLRKEAREARPASTAKSRRARKPVSAS
jgi:hypothetical protein